MAARAIWKGVIRLSKHTVGVKLYAAVQERGVHFTLLQRKTHHKVEQRMVNPETDEAVAYDQIRRGFLSDGEYVMLTKDELDALAPKASRDIAISRFVARQELSPEWFVRPYYVGPDADSDGYFALAQALFESGREGIAHWVMRGVEYAGVLSSDGAHLTLVTLRHEDEVVSTHTLPAAGRVHSAKESSMAEQLVMALDDTFDPSQYKNEHRARVLSLVEQKAKGKSVRLAKVQSKRAAPDLGNALERSLRALEKASGVARVAHPSRAARPAHPSRVKSARRAPKPERHVA